MVFQNNLSLKIRRHPRERGDPGDIRNQKKLIFLSLISPPIQEAYSKKEKVLRNINFSYELSQEGATDS